MKQEVFTYILASITGWLAGAKLLGVTEASWLAVTAPLWIIPVIFGLLFVCVVLVGLVRAIYDTIKGY